MEDSKEQEEDIWKSKDGEEKMQGTVKEMFLF
jgi:hypothetical protein